MQFMAIFIKAPLFRGESLVLLTLYHSQWLKFSYNFNKIGL